MIIQLDGLAYIDIQVDVSGHRCSVRMLIGTVYAGNHDGRQEDQNGHDDNLSSDPGLRCEFLTGSQRDVLGIGLNDRCVV